MDMGEKLTLIIEPTSYERVRANCYFLARLLYSAMMAEISFTNSTDKVVMETDATVKSTYELLGFHDPGRVYSKVKMIISVWSETQVHEALSILAMVKSYAPNLEVSFIGYNPLLDKYGLKKEFEDYTDMIYTGLNCQLPFSFVPLEMGGEGAVSGLTSIPELEDCDCHIDYTTFSGLTKVEVKDKVFQPFLTSVGCPMGCKFCMVSNYQKKAVVMEIDRVTDMFRILNRIEKTCVHLFDDNFLANPERAAEILYNAWIINPEFRFIFLSTLRSAHSFIQLIKGFEADKQSAILSVIHLVEIGLETVDEDISKCVGKDRPKKDVEPKDVMGWFHILWLTITFLPGETIKTLNNTGKFLKDYGLPLEQMLPRMRSAGTWNGLGQFFAPYEGTGIDMPRLDIQGEWLLPAPPMRLLPSWVPYSFLESKFRIIPDGEMVAVSPDSKLIFSPFVRKSVMAYGVSVPDYFEYIKPNSVCTVNDVCSFGYGLNLSDKPYMQVASSLITIAILARLGLAVSED